MRQRARTTIRQLPPTVIVFAALVLVFDGAALAVDGRAVLERPLWTALWTMLGLWLLAALVIGRRQWAWWLGVLGSISNLVSPAWGARLRPGNDVIELVFLALLLTPSMRRHTGVLAGRRETPAPRRWALSPGWVSLGVSGALALVIELEARHQTAQSVGARIFADVFLWLVFAAGIRAAIFIAQRGRRLVGPRDTPAAPEQ